MALMLPFITPNLGYLCTHKNFYKVNRDYQREAGVWTREDKRYLIDTILRNYDVPKIYLREISEKKYEIVDGQQRLQTIWGFKDNKFGLKGTIAGKNYGEKEIFYKDLTEKETEQFDTFQLMCVLLKGYNDDKIRDLFSRLQRGKPLTPGEKLNAKPGTIVKTMRDIGHNSFFDKVVFGLSRYRSFLIVAKMLYLENKGISDISPTYLYDFFDRHQGLNRDSTEARKVNKVLNYLAQTFSDETPELSNDSWVLNIYLLVSDLIDKYAISGARKSIYNFYIDFWKKVEEARRSGTGSKNIQKFTDANRAGTTSKAKIRLRFEIMKQEFLSKNMRLELIDPKRLFDHFEKTVIYRRDDGVCQACGKKVKWEDYEADHIVAHSKGGKTLIAYGQVLCSKCNKKKSAR